MAKDQTYLEAKKKIEAARRSGAQTTPSPASPIGEEPHHPRRGKAEQQMIHPNSYHNSTALPPCRGKLEGGS